MRVICTLVICGALLVAAQQPLAAGKADLIDWQPYSAAVFERAERENKLILLNLEAVWCHWCHVMDQQTYSDEDVAAFLARHYIAVKVDHDARPDLAARYRDYGWPATIFLNAAGDDLVKRAGYIAPGNFLRLLNAIVDDPTPEPASAQPPVTEFASSPLLSDALREELLQRRYATYDFELGGYRSNTKNMDRDTTEYALVRAMAGDEREAGMARLTIDASLALIDPAWGGAYQYSTYGNWDNPHFEKVMAVQAGYLRLYSLAYQHWGDARYKTAIDDMIRYLRNFLTSPDGAYYTSQDADLVQGVKGTEYFALADQARRALGIPRVDTHRYARENGLAIEAVATAYQATDDPLLLRDAVRAAEWVLANRRLIDGGFRHDEADVAGPYLADTLFMGRAFLQLYRATGERRWLTHAADAADFIDTRFRQAEAGFIAGVVDGPVAPVAHIDENVSVTRFLNLLAHYTGAERFRAAAEHGMRYLATRDVATRRIEEGGVLLAALELANDPAHYTVVGGKDDAAARSLYDIARAKGGWYKRIEWWDVDEGPLPNPDVLYPSFEQAAAFVCTNGRCSVPAFSVGQYATLIERLTRIQDKR